MKSVNKTYIAYTYVWESCVCRTNSL